MRQLLSDIWLFLHAYPKAKRIVIELHDEVHAGVVKCQIAYQKLETALLQKGFTKMEGSVCYIAVSLAYYFNRGKPS